MRSVMTIDGFVNCNWMAVQVLLSTSLVVVPIRSEKNTEHSRVSARGIRKPVTSSSFVPKINEPSFGARSSFRAKL